MTSGAQRLFIRGNGMTATGGSQWKRLLLVDALGAFKLHEATLVGTDLDRLRPSRPGHANAVMMEV